MNYSFILLSHDNLQYLSFDSLGCGPSITACLRCSFGISPFADPEGVQGGPEPSEKSQNWGFLAILVQIPWKSQSFQG